MKKLILIAITLFLTACAGTAYQPVGTDMTGGYYHEKHATNYYTVGFVGNGFSSDKQVYDFTMLRAAELGQELGYKYFIVEGVRDKTSYTKSEGPTTITATPTFGGGFTGTAYSNTTTIAKPGYSLNVRYYDKEPSAREGKNYQVASVIEDLKAKHGLLVK